VRYVFGERGRAEQAVGEAKDRVAVALVEREERRLVAAGRTRDERLVCRLIRQLLGSLPAPSGPRLTKVLPRRREKRRWGGNIFLNSSRSCCRFEAINFARGCTGAAEKFLSGACVKLRET
jgi:hypothetical protein